MDRHLYVFDHDGSMHPGFPVLVVDQERMASVDPTTHQVEWKLSGGQPVGSIGTKLLSSPAVGDLDGDGALEIVLGSNEEYVREEEANFRLNNSVWNALKSSLDLPNGRVYAVSNLGNDDPDVAENPSGPFLAGWPVRIGMAIADLLPTVGHGVSASPVLADVDDDGDDEVFINGNNGPAYLLQGDGSSQFGSILGQYNVFDPVTSGLKNPDASSTDFPITFGLLGGGAAGDFFADGDTHFALPSLGAHQLLDAQGPSLQGPGDNQVMAWSADGSALPAFPQKQEDLQFLASPVIADVDGDGVAEILQGSGGYYLHAYSASGGEPAGWPKFTGGWMVGSVGAGDIDGDDKLDVVAITREGNLYAWTTPADYPRDGAKSVQWATFKRDAHRSGNLNSGAAASGRADGCTSEFRAVIEKVALKTSGGSGADKIKISGFANTTGRLLDPAGKDVEIVLGDPEAPGLSVLIPSGSFTGNSKGTSFTYKGAKPGVVGAKFKLKKAFWKFQVKAQDVDVEGPDARVFARLRVGGTCLERTRTCEAAANGKTIKCKKPPKP